MSVGRRWATALAGLAGAVVLAALVVGAGRRSSNSAVPIAVLIGLGAVPLATYIAFQVSPAVTAAAGICLSVFGGNWGYVGTHLPLDRVLLGLSLVRVVLQRRTAAKSRPSSSNPAHLLLIVTAGYAVISAALASTLFTKSGVADLLDRLTIVGFVLYGIAPLLFPTARERGYIIAGLVILGGYLSFTAIAEGIGVHQLVFPRYILNPALGTHFGRARGPFLEAASNGLALVLCAAACQVAVRIWWSRRARVAAALVGVACLDSVIFTLTRQDWLGAAVAVVAALSLTPELRRYLVPVVLVAAIGTVGVLVLVPGLQNSAQSRADSQSPVWDRLNSDNAALLMVEARPILGFGWDRYAAAAGPYYRLAGSYPLVNEVDAVHNVALSNLVELGIIGAGLWLASVLVAFGRVLRERGTTVEERSLWTGLVMCVACYVVVAQFTPLSYEFDNITVWMFAGLLASARHERMLRDERSVQPLAGLAMKTG